MSGTGDQRLERALVARAGEGPADILDLVAAARTALGSDLVEREGAVHAVLLRLVRKGVLRVDGASPRGLAVYRSAAAPPSGEAPWRPRPEGYDASDVEAARSLRDAATRARVEADLAAHRSELRAQGHEESLGSSRGLRTLLKRAERGSLAVFLPLGVGGHLLRFLLHEGPWIAAAVVLFLVLHTYVIKVFVIPSASMLPTLKHGDRVLVRKAGSDWQPERWQVVTYARPGQDGPRTTFVKRAVGLPGENIALWRGDVYIDDHLMAKPEDLNEVVRARVRAWDVSGATPPEGWLVGRLESGMDLWSWNGERFWAGPYDAERRFEIQDVYLELDVDLGAQGGAELLLARGREGTERTQFTLSVHPRAGVRLEHGQPGKAELLASAPKPIQGRVTLRLALVDGVLRAQVGDFAWRGPVSVPTEPAGIGFTVLAPARALALRLDKDLHYGVHGALAVPKDGKAASSRECNHTIGPEAIFCLGDNTDDSRDSRFQDVGDIPLSQLIGPVVGRIWPPSRLGRVR